jgi:hypothetical protein
MELVPLFSILHGLHLDTERRYWIERREKEGSISDIEGDTGQMSTGVEILLSASRNSPVKSKENVTERASLVHLIMLPKSPPP